MSFEQLEHASKRCRVLSAHMQECFAAAEEAAPGEACAGAASIPVAAAPDILDTELGF